MKTNSGGSREQRLAEEIVKLEQEIERLRAALEKIASGQLFQHAHEFARAALAGERKDAE